MIDEVTGPLFALDRRAVIGGGAAFGTVPMFAAPASAATPGALDAQFLTLSPPDMVRQLERVERSLEKVEVVWWYQFFFFGIVRDRSPLRLIRYEGIEMSRCRRVGPDRFEIHGHNLSYPRTMDAAAWLGGPAPALSQP